MFRLSKTWESFAEKAYVVLASLQFTMYVGLPNPPLIEFTSYSRERKRIVRILSKLIVDSELTDLSQKVFARFHEGLEMVKEVSDLLQKNRALWEELQELRARCPEVEKKEPAEGKA
ncbi:hypothetical protein KEM55_001814 [Ascosphaera atra]|nr:hypothetical protein KEM55_001814 [Ascosphaera atra]